MKRALLFAAVAVLPLGASAAPRTKIAVTEVKAVQGVSPGTATILSDIVVSEVARAGFDVVSQSDIAAMVGFEKQRKMLGCSDDSSCLAEIGGALGVDYMLTGQVGQIGTRFRISLLVVDTRKARVAARSAQFCDQNEDALARAAEATVKQLLATVAAGAPKVAAARAPAGEAAPAKVPAASADATAPSQAASSSRPDLAARPALPQPPSPAEPGSGFHPSRRTAWITMGGGAALMLGGVVFGVKAAAAKRDLQNSWANPDYASLYDTKSAEAKSAALKANVCWGAGIATAGVGTWMFFRSRPQLAIAPAAGDGQLGLVAAGSF